MTSDVREIIRYPIVDDDGLDVDPAYRELQQVGPVKVQLPYGEPCWVATSYADCKAVHQDRRFVKELGIGRAMPRTYAMPPLDPSMLANMDPPRHSRIRRLTTAAFARPRILGMQAWIELTPCESARAKQISIACEPLGTNSVDENEASRTPPPRPTGPTRSRSRPRSSCPTNRSTPCCARTPRGSPGPARSRSRSSSPSWWPLAFWGAVHDDSATTA